MSYILDALKRADADRERGHVPGLHSQTAGMAGSSTAGRPSRGQRTAWLASAVLALLVAAAAGWWWSRPAPADPGVELAATRIDADPPPARPAPVPPQTDPATNAPVAEPAITPPAAPVLPILAPPTAPPTAPAAAAPAAAGARPRTAGTGTDAPAAASAVTEPSTPASGTATTAVPRFADLAPELRAQLPAVSINGSTYSQNPAHRMLIANGKVVQEGGEIAPGLKLETIGPRSAVLNHQGTRYSIGY